MFNEFPREFGKYRGKVYKEDELLIYVNSNSRYNSIYTSLYSFPIEDGVSQYAQANVDKIFFDIENGDRCYDTMLKLHEYYEKHDIQHAVIFSGRGFHLYVMLSKKHLKNPREAIMNYVEYLFSHLNICKKSMECESCEEKECAGDKIDPVGSGIGNLAKIVRIPGSYNQTRGKWCICLNHEEVHSGLENIKNLAAKQRIGINFICNRLLSIAKFDGESFKYDDAYIIDCNYPIPSLQISGGAIAPSLDLCIVKILLSKHPSHDERWALVQNLSDLIREGEKYPKEELKKVAKAIVEFIEKNCRWDDFDMRKTSYHVNYTVARFPNPCSCDWFKMRGLCVGRGCSRWK